MKLRLLHFSLKYNQACEPFPVEAHAQILKQSVQLDTETDSEAVRDLLARRWRALCAAQGTTSHALSREKTPTPGWGHELLYCMGCELQNLHVWTDVF